MKRWFAVKLSIDFASLIDLHNYNFLDIIVNKIQYSNYLHELEKDFYMFLSFFLHLEELDFQKGFEVSTLVSFSLFLQYFL